MQECSPPGNSVASVALSHGINTNAIHRWQRLAGCQPTTETLPAFLPVTLESPAQSVIDPHREPPSPYDLDRALTAGLMQRSVLSEQWLLSPPLLYSDNSAPMKSVTMLQKMYDLGVTPSQPPTGE